jgi:DNA topoisomerase-1
MPARRLPSAAARVSELESAGQAGLRYSSDSEPGIVRLRRGRGFSYRRADGRAVDRAALARIRSLVIPPAWTSVWIAADARAHLQATGRDARGRKQYRYHPRWSQVRDAAKFDHLRAFARALPAVRDRVAADLRSRPLSRAWVLATAVRLLERTVIRVGNEEYRRANGSYGLTTLRDRHAKFDGKTLTLQFVAKSGVRQVIQVDDPVLARRVRRCQELPGQILFQYLDEEGVQHSLGSGDVNDYIREAAGAPFTAKDFRTWEGTLTAARALDAEVSRRATSEAARKRAVIAALDAVASRLGNTRAVCRKCYVHPCVADHFLAGRTLSAAGARLRGVAGLDRDERALLALLDLAARSTAAAKAA